jgi:hypothetical protein
MTRPDNDGAEEHRKSGLKNIRPAGNRHRAPCRLKKSLGTISNPSDTADPSLLIVLREIHLNVHVHLA